MAPITITLAILLSLFSTVSLAATPSQSLKAAQTQITKKQFKQALKTLGAIKAEGRLDALRHFHTARAHAGLGQWQEAEQANQRAMNLDAGLVEAPYNNACFMARAGKADRAFHWLGIVGDVLARPDQEQKRARFRDLMAKDPDLASVRKDARYVAAAARIAHGDFRDVVRKTAAMPTDPTAQRLAKAHGLQVMNLTWEDTGRFKGSAVGPNISDMTIQVQHPGGITAMPVIRFPNFEDKTGDVDTRAFTLLVGNQAKNTPLRRISLHELLEEPMAYLSKPDSWTGDGPKTLLAPNRDDKVLVSAQACFLPIPQRGKAEFNPVLFNYQSREKDPAVLTILATREGTSMTIIDNKRDAFAAGALWGQRLFHNLHGERTSLTGERLSDFKATPGGKKTVARAPEQPLNMVLLIQVPLKQKNPMRDGLGAAVLEEGGAVPAPPPEQRGKSDVEDAVIGHGKVEGPFTEIDGLAIERDDRFPVRVTVQFYKATSNGVVAEKDLQDIAMKIDEIYKKADVVGSLVTAGETGRITEYAGAKVQPEDWWEEFWERYEKNTGIKPGVAKARLKQLLGSGYEDKPATELYIRSVLGKKKS